MENSPFDQDSLLPKIDFGNPHPISAAEIRAFFTAICAGKWVLAVKGQPHWAFRAFFEFCRCCSNGLRKKPFGYHGLNFNSANGVFSKKPQSNQIEVQEHEYYKSGMGDGDESSEHDVIEFRKPASLEELAVFLTRGQLIPLDLPVLDSNDFYVPPTAKIYLLFYMAWREIAPFKTVTEIHDWLIRMKAIPPHAKRKDGVDKSRNTRALLKRIGFPLHQGGRPKKKNLQLPA